MAFLEVASFCSLEEYNHNRELRIIESGIENNGLYTYMMRLIDDEKQAAMQAVRILGIKRATGLVAVKFAFLDNDLNTDFTVTEPMSQGFIQQFESNAYFLDDNGRGIKLQEAYLRDYFESQFGNLLTENSKLSIVA
jgi:hypothetical protein